ncbi:hypothetical protein [Kineococcus rhizosphaerae]|uniref:Uncharacterized protein n=1 Tax=Kineococcus rhizosphaerae TaxID=559628 RepID=A0A2T0RAJ4_9ACTN|nr:hypothetical protein [Kineococcus rhizosphaerae]PRY18179.1 hypothetical protein CLV37_101423 [Kineococcus rhizosphaerae]
MSTSMATSMAMSVKAGARVVRVRRARVAATAVCALLWSLLAVVQGTARGSGTSAGQPAALTVATAVLVLVVSVVLWLAAFGTPVPAVGFVLTGLAVVVPLLLVAALRTGLWGRVGAVVGAGVEAGLGALAGAR